MKVIMGRGSFLPKLLSLEIKHFILEKESKREVRILRQP